jgi:hypothetical protein
MMRRQTRRRRCGGRKRDALKNGLWVGVAATCMRAARWREAHAHHHAHHTAAAAAGTTGAHTCRRRGMR